jgi:RimJ/RimL family protein N-acetyltransferase
MPAPAHRQAAGLNVGSQQSPGFSFRPLQASDLPVLREWLLRPHIAEWWGPAQSIPELRADYLARAGEPNATRAYIGDLGASPMGFIQTYVVMGSGAGWWEEETDPGARGTDQFLAEPGQLGKGLGRSMIRAFLEQLFSGPVVSVVQTDPDTTNLRAIHAYSRAGFGEVGPVDTPDGPALLMRCTRQTLGQASQNVP